MNSMFYWLGFSLNPMLFNGIRLKYWIEWKSTQCHWKETSKFKVIERIVSKLIAIDWNSSVFNVKEWNPNELRIQVFSMLFYGILLNYLKGIQMISMFSWRESQCFQCYSMGSYWIIGMASKWIQCCLE